MKGQGLVRNFLQWLGAVAILNGRPIAWPRAGSTAAWVISFGLVAAGFVAKPVLENALGERLPPYIMFFPPVIVSALLGGPQIGLAATAISVTLTWYFFLPAYHSFADKSSSAVVALVMYATLSSFLAWIVGKARLALDSVADSEARRYSAARESVHRIKNLIAVVQALVTKVAKETGSTIEYRDVLCSRLAALAHAQDVLVQSEWSDVELARTIQSALAPFLPNPSLQVAYGDSVRVPARHVGGLSMALYELCTNSIKYGALADGRGAAKLSWKTEGGSVVLEWIEQSPNVVARDEGFGSQLVRYALNKDSNTKVEYAIEGTRVHAVFRWPAAVQ